MTAGQWTCHGCGTANIANDTECLLCGSPPDAHEAEPSLRYEPPPEFVEAKPKQEPATPKPKPKLVTPATRATPKPAARPERPTPKPPASKPPVADSRYEWSPPRSEPLTDRQRRRPAFLARAGFFLTLVCCLPIGPILAAIGHRRMRRRPDVEQRRGWAWATYALTLVIVGLLAVGGFAVHVYQQSEEFVGTWTNETGAESVEVTLERSDPIGASMEGTFSFGSGENVCGGQLVDSSFDVGLLHITARGSCGGAQSFTEELRLFIEDGQLRGFGPPLDRIGS